MNTLPRNARFIGPGRVEYVVSTPASEDPRGWVFAFPVTGGETGFFDSGRAAKDVEVTYP